LMWCCLDNEGNSNQEEPVPVISLNRRFFEWDDKEPPDPEIRLAFGLEEGGVGWDELLLKRRVVILAEAGSGKSTEMAERARITAASCRYSFHATVEDVGRDGLEQALSVSGQESLNAWRASNEEAWFFIDSVDEAKSGGIRLEKVVRRLADGIHGAEQRAHIILSGRITDWEFRKDLESLKRWLPVSSKVSKSEATAEEELLRIIRQERRRDEAPPPSELPFVARMAPLDRERVRLFAQGMSTPNLDRFLEAVEIANLWHFARRPLDLDWLVRFWQSEGRLSSLAEMVERSISERLKETNTDRAREDTLDSAAARHAVERVGAAMVFGRQATIAIPDSEVTFTSDSPLDLSDVLPDWSPENRLLLLSRPVFDPATLGRARFHNDNDSVVRGFLTARWLLRLRRANLSTNALFDLLFARSYGLEVIRPSLTETVAWLSLWDKDVANEVVRRGPLLLLGSGDPATLSPDVRRHALVALAGELTAGDQELLWWDHDKLRRFAQADLGSVVASLWPQYRTNKQVARVLLRIAWLGALKDCAKLAYDAAFDTGLDSTARVFAGRALLVTADEAARKSYAELVMAEESTLPKRMVRDAMVDLFPTLIGVEELLEMLEAMDDSSEETGLGFDSEGPRLVGKLNAPSDLEKLLRGLLTQVGGELGEHAHYPPSKREVTYFPAMAVAALRLLQVGPPDSAPEVAVDAILRICNRWDHGAGIRASANSALKELHRTSARRRTAFWRVAHSLRSSRARQKIDQLWQMEILGYPAGLQIEDVDWLLADGLARGEDDRRLAVDAALTICRSAGEPPGLSWKISSAVSSDAVASEVYREVREPRRPSPEHLEKERELREIESANAAEQAKRDQSWIDFIRELRNDYERIENLRIPAPSGINSDLLDLWRLLNGASSQSRYAIDSVAPLERIAGAEIAAAAQAGLIAYWRNSAPLLRSQRPAKERDTIRSGDLMGLTGVTMEAASVSGWVDRLSFMEATRAAGYATLEINGFPRWMSQLAAAKSAEVRAVLMAEILDEITRTEPVHRDTLHNVAYGDEEIAKLLGPVLLDDLATRAQVPLGALSLILHIIRRGVLQERAPQFIKLGVERFQKEPDVDAAVQYLAAVFSLDPKAAAKVLAARVAPLNADEQATLVDRFLSASFGDSISGSVFNTTDVPAETLDELVRLTFQTHGSVAGRSRPAGVVYRMDENDHADHARIAVFGRFVKTPGAATYQALLRLQRDPNCPIPSARLRELARDRAIQDSENAPWVSSEALAFEQHHETAPRTAKDLRSVLVSRLDDMQHDLLHGDFAQGLTLKSRPKEVDVQNWVADRLRLKQGRAFSVEREPHVINEKEPDVRIRAKATDASVAMEIKVAENWTLKELDDALEVQLCGRYLRASDGRFGVLLLVHQDARRKGWEDTTTATYLSFAEVVARLSARAAVIAGAHHDSPQPEVCVLDVSRLQART
jgi:hypothetical protein